MKKTIALTIIAAILLSGCSKSDVEKTSVNNIAETDLYTDTFAFAEDSSAEQNEILQIYDIAETAVSTLIISDNTASCSSIALGKQCTQISVTHTLQKQGFMWFWDDVDNAVWSKLVDGDFLSLTTEKPDLSDGTYRLESVFTLTKSNDQTETITIYSDEFTWTQTESDFESIPQDITEETDISQTEEAIAENDVMPTEIVSPLPSEYSINKEDLLSTEYFLTETAKGEEVYAIADGEIIGVGWFGGFGRTVIIRHADRVSLYCHLDDFVASEGDIACAGDIIGHTGSSGQTTKIGLGYRVITEEYFEQYKDEYFG